MSHPKGGAWTVAALAVILYAAYIGGLILTGTDARSFIVIGRPFLTQSHTSSVIRYDPHARYYTKDGYDGQFFYFMALDPVHARDYMSMPAYRYGRILYPALARAISLGHLDWIPGILLLINLVAVGLGVWAVAAWLLRAGLSPWPALLYALYPGTVVAVTRDLSDVLALSLVAVAVYAFRYGGRYALPTSAVLFALAGLTRETMLAAAAMFAVQLLAERRFLTGVLFGLVAAVPYLAWHTFVGVWMGSMSVPAAAMPTFPLWGLIAYGVPSAIFVLQMIAVVFPGVIAAGIALYLWRRTGMTAEILALLVNVLIGVVLLNHASYIEIEGSARAAGGVPLFLLFCLPLIRTNGAATLFRLAWLLWMFPYLILGKMVAVRWIWIVTALAWVISAEIEIVRQLRRGIRGLSGLGRRLPA